MSASAPEPLGVVAHYNLLERLEPAGPGELFRARDTHLGRTVAIRLLPADYAADPHSRAELLDRARGVAALSHPNITTIFEAGEDAGCVFLAFEFLRGQSLRAELAGRPMNVRRAVDLAIQIADAVADAHAAGYVHGGLSADSITVTAKGHAKIPAFELASRGGFERGDGEVRLRDYDAPEEARGQAVDERSDIYSVGAVLYEMLTMRRPLHRGSAAPGVSNSHVSPELDDIVIKAVAPNPDSRYQSAATLAAELRSLAAILEVRGVVEDDGENDGALAASVGRAVMLAVGILLALGVVVWWFWRV